MKKQNEKYTYLLYNANSTNKTYILQSSRVKG